VALFGFVVLFEVLRRRIGGVYGRELRAGIAKVLIASLALAAVTALSSHGMERWLGVSQLARLADLAVSIPLGLAVFYGTCRALGVSELDMAIRAFSAPIRRRLRRNAP
jgi:putative peptidoglycan lipid II flippase